jgi:hypothetical protein
VTDDHKPRANLSTVAPIVEGSNELPEQIRRELVKLASQWVRSAIKRFGGWLALLVTGAGAGAGTTAYLDDDAPTERNAAASGPQPEPRPDLEMIQTCEQCRDDARLAIEIFGTQARACGVETDELPRPIPPPLERRPPSPNETNEQ